MASSSLIFSLLSFVKRYSGMHTTPLLFAKIAYLAFSGPVGVDQLLNVPMVRLTLPVDKSL